MTQPGLAWRGRRPYAFAVVVMAVYALALLPFLLRDGFDPSIFIVAGDRFVDTHHLISPIIVLPHTNGYDGQFYYRMALAPWRLAQPSFGITFDNPPWRMQRMFYPLLTWVVTAGQAILVPSAMVLLNILGLGAIAAFAARITTRLRLHDLTPLAIVLWPGLIVSLTRDMTEIGSVALLLAALDCYLADRLLAYALVGALGTLTREVGILALASVFCLECVTALRGGTWYRHRRRLLVCAAAMVPFVVWRWSLQWIWGEAPQGNIAGWPLVGAFSRLSTDWLNMWSLAHAARAVQAIRVYALFSAVWALGVYALIAARTPAVLRRPDGAMLAAVWLPIFALMSLLTANGPWIEPLAYLRAFSEGYVIGCLLLGLQGWRRYATGYIFAGGVLTWAGAWITCFTSVQ